MLLEQVYKVWVCLLEHLLCSGFCIDWGCGDMTQWYTVEGMASICEALGTITSTTHTHTHTNLESGRS
jgi:hypothetical protein